MSFNSFYLTESVKEATKSNGIISLLELFHLAKKKNKIVDLEIGTNFDKFCEDLNLLEYKDVIKIIAALLEDRK